MSAVAIMRALLLSRSSVTDLVPAARVIIGAIEQGTTLPAIAITSVGSNEIGTVARNGSHSTVRERVQVTVYARGYPEQERVLLACKLPGIPRGTVGEFQVNAVEPMGTNPAMVPGEDRIYERSRDFMVTFKEAN